MPNALDENWNWKDEIGNWKNEIWKENVIKCRGCQSPHKVNNKEQRTNKVNGASRRMPEMKRLVIAFVRIAIFVYIYVHTQEPHFSLQLIKE